jgi:MFS family permease
LAAALGWMLDAFDVMLYSIVLTSLMRDLAMDKRTAGLLNSLTLVASAVGSVVFGILADRLGRRKMLSASILVYSIFTFACGFSRSIGMLAVFRFCLGLGMGGEWNTGAALVAETWPSSWRGRALGLVQSSWAIGYAAAAVVANAILSRAGWRWVFFAGVLPALLVLWIRRGVPEPAVWTATRDRIVLPEQRRQYWREAAPRLAVLIGMNTCGMFAWWGLFTWIPAYLALPASGGGRNFSLLGLTAFLVVVNLCGMLPGYLLFGVLADKLGRKPMLVTYLALAAGSVLLFALAERPAVILLTASVAAFFGTGFFTGSAIAGAEAFPTAIRATALGTSYNVARGLSALAPFVIGTLGQSHGLSWAFGLCAISFAAAALFATRVPETRGLEIA